MKYLVVVCTLALMVAVPCLVHAQVITPMQAPENVTVGQSDTERPVKIDIRDQLARRPESKAALAEFHRRKAAGLLAKNTGTQDEEGDIRDFRVLNNSTNQFEDIQFELKVIRDRFQVWVEVAELNNGNVTEFALDEVVAALGTRTPTGSINPDAGIIENDEVIFGEPPNVDGDGKTDVLLLDIRDDYDPDTNPFLIAGFVTESDLSAQGNNRDIMYLDTNPLLAQFGVEEMALTAVHEYQHLILFNYDRDEISFVNEGLSEWAEVALGYLSRTIDYLEDVQNYNVWLLRFNAENSIDDRERGALFTNYIADRFGILEAGSITRQGTHGTQGYRDALAAMTDGIPLADLISDFHIANFINDTNVDPRYGYTTAQRLNLRAAPSVRFDGRTVSDTPTTSTSVAPGGVQYLVWDQVEDLMLSFAITSGEPNVRPTALLYQNGSVDVQPLDLVSDDFAFNGTYDRIAIVVAHINADASTSNFTYSASWTTDTQVSLVTTQYDDGQAGAPNDQNPFFTLTGSTNPGVAVRFMVPSADDLTTLDRVFIAPTFLSQFSNGGQPADAPRDVRIHIWAPNANGLPGQELFAQDIQDPRTGQASTTLNFWEVDLSSAAAQLSNLPDTLFVGYTNAGTDANSFVFSVSLTTEAEDVSLVTSDVDQGWGRLWGVGSGDSLPFEQTVIPIRAQFAIPTSTALADADEVPERILLAPNYPNPFNPTTTIHFALPQAEAVRLTVYDLLGREVAVLLDGMQASGEHLLEVNASDWASGVYFYTLETANQLETRRMVLIK